VRGAVLSACPEATVVDVCHELPAHDIAAAAFALAAAHRAFPPGTVFVAVVDPGVGSERRGLALEAADYVFVGPDNGIFSLILAEHPAARVRLLANPRLFRTEISTTCHARDVFGPIAGHLAGGVPLDEVGPPVSDPIVLPVAEVRRRTERQWEGAVIQVDRFGNLTTNVSRRELEAILGTVDDNPSAVVVLVEDRFMPIAHTYGDVPEGDVCALMGSSGYLEIAVHRGSAAHVLGATRGTPVVLRTVDL
jgi:S-adenosyl-L-methionine hydrolase (adenosine-forming)